MPEPASSQFLFLPDVLQWRAHTTPDHPLFLLLNAKVRAGPAGACGCMGPLSPVHTPQRRDCAEW